MRVVRRGSMLIKRKPLNNIEQGSALLEDEVHELGL